MELGLQTLKFKDMGAPPPAGGAAPAAGAPAAAKPPAPTPAPAAGAPAAGAPAAAAPAPAISNPDQHKTQADIYKAMKEADVKDLWKELKTWKP